MIPFDKGKPFLGHFFTYQKDKTHFLTKMHAKHGDTFKIKIGNFNLTVITDPEDIARVMQVNFSNYIKKTNLQFFFGSNIFFSNGETWREQRNLTQPAFRNENIINYIPTIEQICHNEFSKLSESDSLDIQDFLYNVSFKIITSTIVGKEFVGHQELKEHLKIVTHNLSKTKYLQTFSFLFPKQKKQYKESCEYIDQVIYKIIAEKRKSKTFDTDTLSMYVKLSENENSTLTDKDIRDQLITLIFAGYETTALTMSWLVYLLAKNNSYQQILNEEFKKISESQIKANENTSFLKIDNIIKEAMRLYPAGWAWTRVAEKDDTLRKHEVKGGEIIFISPYLTHRSPLYWKDPLKFYPERFTDEQIIKGSYIPFGVGPRTCIGMGLGMIQMRIMLKHLIQRFEIIDCHFTPIIKPQMTLDVEKNIRVGLKKRPE
jgi:cytochrome P450